MPTSGVALLALLLGAAFLAVTTVLAVRRGAGASSFGWAVINGLAFAVLGLAAALRLPESLGLGAALAQAFSVVLAGLLGSLCAPTGGSTESALGRLGLMGRVFAWLTLIGLPPTPGFHAKMLLYRALLRAGWPWALALALAASWLLLLPALREVRTVRPGTGGARGRAIAAGVLVVLLVALSILPYLWLQVGSPGVSTDLLPPS